MDEIITWLSHPWHWAVSGAMISVVMLTLRWLGGEFGVSANLRTLCTLGGAGRRHAFFDFDWRSERWNLLFVAGSILGGFIAVHFLPSTEPVRIAAATEVHLASMGIRTPQTIEEGRGFVPRELFATPPGAPALLVLMLGGFLVGFGARWAGGCTSGHAISGLSNLQWPSLVAVVGFFIGGLLMTWVVLPLLLTGQA